MDQIALEAAYSIDNELITTGGWAPIGFMTSSGPNNLLFDRYGLKQLEEKSLSKSLASQYVARSMRNVDDCDATIAFLLYKSVGTIRTIGYCQTGKWMPVGLPQPEDGIVDLTAGSEGLCNKPCLVITSLAKEKRTIQLQTIGTFLATHRVEAINICGHRNDSKFTPYRDPVVDFMIDIMSVISDKLSNI